MASVVGMALANFERQSNASDSNNSSDKCASTTTATKCTAFAAASALPLQQHDPIAQSIAAVVDKTNTLDDDDPPNYVLLHLIRILALYLYVFVAQHPLLLDNVLQSTLYPPNNATSATTSKALHAALEHELHAVLLALVEHELTSNQFDGLVHEQRAFHAIRKLFRVRSSSTAAQSTALAALLATYVTLLPAPIVECLSASMLASTLEYLVCSKSVRLVALPLLYPIVNAIDSLRIEQRECLDALTTLWQSLATTDGVIRLQLVQQHHAVVLGIATASTDNRRSASLSACFLTTLLEHADHIFRHDPAVAATEADAEEMFAPSRLFTLSRLESDTDEEDDACDACDMKATAQSIAPAVKTPTLPRLTATEVEVAAPLKMMTQSATTSLRKSMMRRRKKKAVDDKQPLQAVATTTPPPPPTARPMLLDDHVQKTPPPLEAIDGKTTTKQQQQQQQQSPESLPTAMCVGIAAAAGTIAAALCVIFN